MIETALATIACKRKGTPFWLLPPPATTTPTTEHWRLDMLCMLCAVSRLLALLHLRYGRLSSHLTLRTFYLCSLFLSSFWCWPASYSESCKQGGGSTRTHFLLCVVKLGYPTIHIAHAAASINRGY